MRKGCKAGVEGKTFVEFCQKHKIAKDSIRWLLIGDKTVKIAIKDDDFKQGGWSLLSVALMFAMRQLDMVADVTIRASKGSIEAVLEK